MNEKGGMTDVKFEKYIDISIVPLFPELEDTNGKRVMLKVDSGPRSMILNILAMVRAWDSSFTLASQI